MVPGTYFRSDPQTFVLSQKLISSSSHASLPGPVRPEVPRPRRPRVGFPEIEESQGIGLPAGEVFMFGVEVAEVLVGLLQQKFSRVDEEGAPSGDLRPWWSAVGLPRASKRLSRVVTTYPDPGSRREASGASELVVVKGS